MIKLLAYLCLLGMALSCGKSPSTSVRPVGAGSSPQVRPSGAGSSPQIDPVVVDAYLQMVNTHREKLGLRKVALSPVIEDVALGHSSDMALGRKFFGHGGWRERCKELRDRLQGSLCGEIVAFGQKDHQQVFEAWLNSPHHREVIEGPDYTHTGLGFVANEKGTIYWTQLFLEIEK